MKRTALTGLLLSSVMLASPVFAADDLCGSNLQTIKDAQVSTNANLSPDLKQSLAKTETDARAAQAKGDNKTCVELTTQAITELKNIGSGSEGGSK
ncbi:MULTISPECIES: hypothetical protein [Pseudomonas]|uniref:Secreted protein n=2 Tax=Pseudomonas TaxID=286 RepID=A0ABX8HTW5_9PSED|nr:MULTISPECIES: hypothetical protein [Pseudomonas]MBI6853293.1 hypothetical protein [Pseudomonas cichorii]MBN6716711.1 hypothetical protein [Pseudomonas capsici]MBN6721795.1 hypothetical protein [Pseudomonas capsici]MBN6726807.1 hypothetical protein [Pseudomonas capsici]MBX8476367.1 hypothetical protein [Pseudomonas cichorii]